MNKYIYFCWVLLFVQLTKAQSIGIGTLNPNPYAALEISDSSRGIIIPRMDSVKRKSMPNVVGMLVYDSSYKTFWYNNGTSWVQIVPNPISNQSGVSLVVDGNGNTFPVVTICEQKWTQKNLAVDTYRNGDPIPKVSDGSAWFALTTGAWCNYNNDPLTEPVFGKLYNWYAVTDPRGLAPTGWHIPTFSEFLTLAQDCLVSDQGIKMRTTGNSIWFFNSGSTNSSGFSALPAGYRNDVATFISINRSCYFWSSSVDPTNPGAAYCMGVNENGAGVNFPATDKRSGLSVRCIKD